MRLPPVSRWEGAIAAMAVAPTMGQLDELAALHHPTPCEDERSGQLFRIPPGERDRSWISHPW